MNTQRKYKNVHPKAGLIKKKKKNKEKTLSLIKTLSFNLRQSLK